MKSELKHYMQALCRRDVVVASLGVLTKLLYIGPG